MFVRKKPKPEPIKVPFVGVDAQLPESPGEPEFDPAGHSVFNQAPPAEHNKAAADVKPAVDEKVAARQAAADKKREAKETAKAERERKAADAADAKASAKAKRAALRARAAEQRQAAADAARENGLTYAGSMLALRSAKAAYVKSATGRLRSDDEVARLFDEVEPVNVIKLCLLVLGLPNNPYVHLNVGQQSMNLRNRVRGAVKKGALTAMKIVSIREEHELRVSDEEIAARAERRAAAMNRAKKVADSATPSE